MLIAPVLMRSIRNGPQTIQKKIRKLSMSPWQREDREDKGPPKRPTFRSVCGLATELSVVITIIDRMSTTDKSVFYKDDEDRFRQRHTLKLKTCYQYYVQMEVTPSLTISYLMIGGINYDAIVTQINVEDGKTFCSFTWSTKHIKITPRKYRSILPCVIKFSGYKEIHFEVMVKFYKNEDTLHYGGVPLSSLGIYGTLCNDKQQKEQIYDIVFT